MIQDALRKVGENESLSVEEATAVAEEMMTGEATPAQIAGFLVALRMKGESVEEITGMAKVMREKALRVSTDGEVLDVVTAGGHRCPPVGATAADSPRGGREHHGVGTPCRTNPLHVRVLTPSRPKLDPPRTVGAARS